MNPKNILIFTLIIVLSSCGTSSNFQKRKHLNLKPLETSSTENTSFDVKKTSDLVHEENFEEASTTQFGENVQSVEYHELNDEIIEDNSIVEKRNHPEKTTEKIQELLEPDDPEDSGQRKAIIFASIAVGLVILAAVMSFLLFIEIILPILGIILMSLFIIGALTFGILAIIRAAKALGKPKKGVRDWILRFLSLGGGIIGIVAGTVLLVDLLLFILFF